MDMAQPTSTCDGPDSPIVYRRFRRQPPTKTIEPTNNNNNTKYNNNNNEDSQSSSSSIISKTNSHDPEFTSNVGMIQKSRAAEKTGSSIQNPIPPSPSLSPSSSTSNLSQASTSMDKEIEDFLSRTQLTASEYQKRVETLEELQLVLDFGVLHAFGSFITGVGNRNSDIDVYFLDNGN